MGMPCWVIHKRQKTNSPQTSINKKTDCNKEKHSQATKNKKIVKKEKKSN
jgi:hypothetical protein